MRNTKQLWGGANSAIQPPERVCGGASWMGAPPSTAQPSIYKTTQAHNTTLTYTASYSSIALR